MGGLREKEQDEEGCEEGETGLEIEVDTPGLEVGD